MIVDLSFNGGDPVSILVDKCHLKAWNFDDEQAKWQWHLNLVLRKINGVHRRLAGLTLAMLETPSHKTHPSPCFCLITFSF